MRPPSLPHRRQVSSMGEKVSESSMGEKVSETWITSPKRLLSQGAREACLVHIYPTGQSMGCRYPLGDRALVLGRGEDCDIRIQDHSVSRRHAKVEPSPEGYFV